MAQLDMDHGDILYLVQGLAHRARSQRIPVNPCISSVLPGHGIFYFSMSHLISYFVFVLGHIS